MKTSIEHSILYTIILLSYLRLGIFFYLKAILIFDLLMASSVACTTLLVLQHWQTLSPLLFRILLFAVIVFSVFSNVFVTGGIRSASLVVGIVGLPPIAVLLLPTHAALALKVSTFSFLMSFLVIIPACLIFKDQIDSYDQIGVADSYLRWYHSVLTMFTTSSVFLVLIYARVSYWEEIVRTKDRFIGSVTHELRTPIAAIVGFCSLHLIDRPQDEAIQAALRAASSLEATVETLLTHSKMQVSKAKNAHVVMQSYDLLELVQHALEMSKMAVATTKSSAVSLRVVVVDCGDMISLINSHRFYGAADTIKQCILVCLSNALKYTKEGSVTVALSAERCDDEQKALIRISIQDTGCGIEKDQLQHIFEPFYRSSSNTSGFGVGLSVLKGLVEGVLVNGIVKVDSIIGEGSKFTFDFIDSIDCEKSAVLLATETTALVAAADDDDGGDGDGLLVLYVEDSSMLQSIGKRFITKLGHHALLATTFDEGLALYDANYSRLSLIVVDYMLRHNGTSSRTGLELAVEIRRREATSERLLPTPIVVLSAIDLSMQPNVVDESLLASAGITEWLSKTEVVRGGASLPLLEKWRKICSFASKNTENNR